MGLVLPRSVVGVGRVRHTARSLRCLPLVVFLIRKVELKERILPISSNKAFLRRQQVDD